MSMSDEDHAALRLESYFEAARAHPPVPSAALMASVLRAAETMQPAPPRVPLAARLRAASGGWPVLAGLAAAAAALGVWIGAALPGANGSATEAAYLVDVAPELAFVLAGDF